jgi:hypothetical protein
MFARPCRSLAEDPAEDACVKHKYCLRSIIEDIPALLVAKCSAG